MKNLGKLQSFIFGEGTENPTYEDIKTKRALQQALMSKLSSSAPSTAGGGINAIFQGVTARRAGNQASQGEEAGRAGANEQWTALQSLFGQSRGMAGGAGADAMQGSAGNDTLSPEQNMPMPGGVAPAGSPIQNMPMAGGGAATGSPLQNMGGLPASIVRTESGGNWRALNSEGYGGRGQFGTARLADAARAGIIPAGMTGAQYSQAPESVQLAVENWHKQDILGDLGKYVGQDIDGPGGIPPLTENSILGVAHLGGTGGARKFIESGGRYNPSDSNGTSLADYATTHAGGMAGGQGNAAMMGGEGGDQMAGGQPLDMGSLSQIAEFMGNPWADDGQKALAGMMMQRIMAQSAPVSEMDRLALQKAQLEVQQMENPVADQTSAMQEYQYAQQQGFQGTFMEYQSAKSEAGRAQNNVTVNTGDGEVGRYLYGTDAGLPAGWRLDRETGEASEIPGGPAAQETADAAAAGQVADDNKNRSGGIVTQDIDRALSIVKENPRWTTGIGANLSSIPGTEAKSLAGLLQTIKANVGFDRLQQMRDASVTGGALGAINETEMQLLQSVLGNLDQSLDAEDLARNLERVNQVYLEIINGPGGGVQPPDAAAPPPPQGTSLSQDEWSRAWSAMTPEEKALFQ